MSRLVRTAGIIVAVVMMLGAAQTAALAAAVTREWAAATASAYPRAPLILVLGDRPGRISCTKRPH